MHIRAGRLVNHSKVVLLREISNFVEKKCSESVETALDLLTPLYNDIIERLTKEPNQNSDTSDNDSESELDNSHSDGSAPENQKNSSSNSGSDKEYESAKEVELENSDTQVEQVHSDEVPSDNEDAVQPEKEINDDEILINEEDPVPSGEETNEEDIPPENKRNEELDGELKDASEASEG